MNVHNVRVGKDKIISDMQKNIISKCKSNYVVYAKVSVIDVF